MGSGARAFLAAIIALLAALLLSVAVGSVLIPPLTLARLLSSRLPFAHPPVDWLAENQAAAAILFQLRLPRTALVALTGAALAGSGAAYQGLFRNPLADPYLIGVASGAGLGAVIAISLRAGAGLGGQFAVPAAAFVAALLSVALVYALARSRGRLPAANLILAGVAVSAFTGALTSFLMLRSTGELRRALAWLLGGATASGWQPVLAMLPYVLVGLVTVSLMGHALNVLQFGDEQAQQLGLPVARARLIIIVAASLASAAAVAFSGVIGFVGLIVPHVARLLWGGDYRRLVPLSIVLGAALLLLADVLARVVMAPQELPVGVVMALAGAPFFLWLLRRSRLPMS